MLPPFFYTASVSGNHPSQSRPIYLVGMMGAGKSTVGPGLAARLGRPFLDIDQEVERVSGYEISEIFEREGETRFRELEAEAIERASQEGAVIALGGGAISQPGAAERLVARGCVVFLRADPEILIERIGDASTRPLLAGLDRGGQIDRLRSLLAERLVHYQRASIEVDASRRAEEVVDEIVVALQAD
ncbi:MAG: shikimate kinase [bacterium]|nr:shikimate kinase [Deltaproteobacteria bacterium]MCP4906675.1 shikimate kinase [bacterium]